MTIALIDGDILCYAACEDRYTRSVKNVEALQGVFGEEYDAFKVMTGEDAFSDEENEAYLYQIFDRFKKMVHEVADKCYADTFRVAVGGKGNYRDSIYPAYKANRRHPGIKKNPFVPLLRELTHNTGFGTAAHGMEADDLLRIWAEECREAEEKFVICSSDKDLKMIPGTHYLTHHEKFFEATPEFSMRFYYEQLLKGDPTDNIQGLPGVGPEKAKKYLEGCVTETDFQEAVMQAYYATVHQWRHALQLTGQLIYLKKHKDDWFDMSNWPVVTLEDIINQPKKSKKPMDAWDLQTALDAINPFSITTRQRWESALLYLLELKQDLPKEVSDAIDVISTRDMVPSPEKEAYHLICAYYKRGLVVDIKAPVDERFNAPPKVVTPLPSVSLPVLPTPPKAAIEEPQKVVTTLIPSGIPVFNPAWNKKK